MTEVRFYLLQQCQGEALRHRFACRLLDKAVRQGHQVYVHAEHAEHAAQFGQLLWRCAPTAFLPHATADHPQALAHPIVIGWPGVEPSLELHDQLLNLALQQPSFFSRFNRLLEIVTEEQPWLEQSRERYRYYQQRGFSVQHQAIAPKASTPSH